MFADIMKIPVETIKANQTGALGCAIAAAMATGQYETLDQAVTKMSEIGGRYEPNTDSFKYYDKRYHLYRNIIDALDPVWDEMQENIEYS